MLAWWYYCSTSAAWQHLSQHSPKPCALTHGTHCLQGAKMDYTVAVDGRGQAAQALMGAAGVSGIPHAFIVGAA